MGVNINPLIKDVKKTINFENLVGKKIAIDAFNMIFQFLAIIRGIDGTPLKDLKGNVTSHLSGLFYRSLIFLEKNIIPIYVFDGQPNPLKQKEIEKRRERRIEATLKMREAQDLGDYQEAAKYAQASSRLTTEMIEEGKNLLMAMGIPVVNAPQDGEAQAAYLVKKNLAWAVGSQDYDSLLFGANRIVRNLSQNRTRKIRGTTVKINLEWISLEKVLQTLEITHEQLVDLGILVGVDFFPGIEGIGPKTALKLIKKYGSFETIIEQKVQAHGKPIEIDPDLLQQIRSIFLKPNVTEELPPLKLRAPNKEKIIEILCEKHDFSRERVEHALQKLVNKKSSATQLTIDSFFKK